MSDYRVTIKVQNNNIVKRILESGYKSVMDFCQTHETIRTFYSRLNSIINMKTSPLNQSGKFHPGLIRVAGILGCMVEDFFSESQLNTSLQTNKRILQVAEAEIKFILENKENIKSLEQNVYEHERTLKIKESLDLLSIREKKVISMRFGLGDYDREHTLDEISKKYDVTRERIRHIEALAIRKLRLSNKIHGLKEFTEGDL